MCREEERKEGRKGGREEGRKEGREEEKEGRRVRRRVHGDQYLVSSVKITCSNCSDADRCSWSTKVTLR